MLEHCALKLFLNDKIIDACFHVTIFLLYLIEGEDDLNVAKTLHNSAIIYSESGEFTAAIECLQEALLVRKLVFGDANHEDISKNVLWIGRFCVQITFNFF